MIFTKMSRNFVQNIKKKYNLFLAYLFMRNVTRPSVDERFVAVMFHMRSFESETNLVIYLSLFNFKRLARAQFTSRFYETGLIRAALRESSFLAALVMSGDSQKVLVGRFRCIIILFVFSTSKSFLIFYSHSTMLAQFRRHGLQCFLMAFILRAV